MSPRVARRALPGIALLLALASSVTSAADLGATSPVAVKVDGQVLQPGRHTLPPRARLADAALAAGVRADAYLPGASWLHQPAKAAQRDLKVGLIHDLSVLIRNARLDNMPDRAALGLRLRTQVEALPITGRLVNVLDPVRLELDRKPNRPMHDGDELYYPARPDTVLISGAVASDCVLPFVSRQAATDYARACPLHTEADTDWLYIIGPDGSTRRLAIAAWNREAPPALAPGSLLLVPLRSRPDQPTDELNTELASFLGTQPLPAVSEQR